MEKKHIVGILIGEAPSLEKAKSVVENGSRCPYSVTYVNSGRTIIGVSVIPLDHKWWLEWVEEHPEETIGLTHVEVFFTRKVNASSPWSRGEVKPLTEISPCGSSCEKCPRYRKECKGCPATRYYINE
ncbi:MAG: hypothetical protein KAV48_06650 [Methanomicrobia archaeon]|nr:hypothetical protein [Methanomicrobia archaeon]MCK4310119.1 hypothetical protein [Methanomicrobia archaeon]MCK4433597.1 hypothetical protein [Methanomicrobia archaeon]